MNYACMHSTYFASSLEEIIKRTHKRDCKILNTELEIRHLLGYVEIQLMLYSQPNHAFSDASYSEFPRLLNLESWCTKHHPGDLGVTYWRDLRTICTNKVRMMLFMWDDPKTVIKMISFQI